LTFVRFFGGGKDRFFWGATAHMSPRGYVPAVS